MCLNKIDIGMSCFMDFIFVYPDTGTHLSWWPLRRMHAVWKLLFPFLPDCPSDIPVFSHVFVVCELFLQLANKVSSSLVRSSACLCQFPDCLPSGPGSRLECSSSFAINVPE